MCYLYSACPAPSTGTWRFPAVKQRKLIEVAIERANARARDPAESMCDVIRTEIDPLRSIEALMTRIYFVMSYACVRADIIASLLAMKFVRHNQYPGGRGRAAATIMSIDSATAALYLASADGPIHFRLLFIDVEYNATFSGLSLHMRNIQSSLFRAASLYVRDHPSFRVKMQTHIGHAAAAAFITTRQSPRLTPHSSCVRTYARTYQMTQS